MRVRIVFKNELNYQLIPYRKRESPSQTNHFALGESIYSKMSTQNLIEAIAINEILLFHT